MQSQYRAMHSASRGKNMQQTYMIAKAVKTIRQ